MNIEINQEDQKNSITNRFAKGISNPSNNACTSGFAVENISEDFMKIWNKFPNAVRLDPSLDFMQKEWERLHINLPDLNMMGSDNLTRTVPPHAQVQLENSQSCNVSQYTDSKCSSYKRRIGSIAQYVKVLLLITCWIMFSITLLLKTEKLGLAQQIALERHEIRNLTLVNSKWNDRISVTIESPLLLSKKNLKNHTSPTDNVTVWLELMNLEDIIQNVSTAWVVPLLPIHSPEMSFNKEESNVFHLNLPQSLNHHSLLLKLKSNTKVAIPLTVSYDQSPVHTEKGIIYGAVLLLGLYILIIFEIVNKTVAAVIASTSSLAVLAILDQRPTMPEIMTWIDIDTLLLLFSMMLLVAIISNTGIFDFLAVYAYKITHGKVWPLVCTLCFSTALISSCLDNVTVILLVTPMTIRLCKVMGLKPVPILSAMVIFSNIGGGMTPVGDPPNVIIASHHDVIEAGIDFGTFTAHMSLGVILVLIVMYGHFRFIFRNIDDLRLDNFKVASENIKDLKNKSTYWKNLANAFPTNNSDESRVKDAVMLRLEELDKDLENKLSTQIYHTDFEITLKELQNKYPIQNKWLLVKSAFSMTLVLVLFFFHSSPDYNLSLGWTAFLGVLLLAILADTEDFEGIITKVEWSTLLFFAALFVMMEALAKLGLIDWIGRQIEYVVMSVSEEYRLAVAILIMLWVSAIIGAFFDNVPLTTMLIRIALGLAENETLKLPLQPLIWALAFGACLGGNGTLIGATANVVCAGVAEQHGHHLTFMQFFKMGFPVLITSNITITVYLMIAHVVFGWNT